MQTETLPKFEGKLLVEIPVQETNFLVGEFGEFVLGLYNARVKENYSDNDNLRVLSYLDGVIKGSNPFAVVLINEIINEQGLKTANQSDLEKILKLNTLDLRGTYEDSALILRDNKEPNSYLAKDLLSQIKNTELPVMIDLSGLKLRTDNNSSYGLMFDIKEDLKLIYNPILNQSGNFLSKDIDPKTGLPTKLKGGARIFYTGDSGLSKLYLYNGLNQDASDDHLAGSDDVGRVVVVKSPEGTQKNLEEYILKLKSEADKQRAVIDKKYEKAISILQDN